MCIKEHIRNVLLAILIFGFQNLSAQDIEASIAPWPAEERAKMREMYAHYLKDDFKIFRKANLNMKPKTEFPVYLQLTRGKMYHFMMFFDPTTERVEMKLGKEGVGHIITDKFYPLNKKGKKGYFFTEFSFICPQSGTYLLTLFQKTGKKKPIAQMCVFQKVGPDGSNNIEFSH